MFQNPDIFERIMLNYEIYFCSLFFDAIDDGYDWDVINQMVGFEVTRERFVELVEGCLEKVRGTEMEDRIKKMADRLE